MPYIPQAQRDLLDPSIRSLVKALKENQLLGPGHLNYVVTTLLVGMDYPSKGYKGLSEVMGILESVKLEWYRRVGAPYEDDKCTEAGDVF